MSSWGQTNLRTKKMSMSVTTNRDEYLTVKCDADEEWIIPKPVLFDWVCVIIFCLSNCKYIFQIFNTYFISTSIICHRHRNREGSFKVCTNKVNTFDLKCQLKCTEQWDGRWYRAACCQPAQTSWCSKLQNTSQKKTPKGNNIKVILTVLSFVCKLFYCVSRASVEATCQMTLANMCAGSIKIISCTVKAQEVAAVRSGIDDPVECFTQQPLGVRALWILPLVRAESS